MLFKKEYMVKIDWRKFEIKHPNYREAFEELSYHIFCRKYKMYDGIFAYKNQTGIEAEPIKIGKKYIGFQAKYFDNKINVEDIIESIEKAKSKNQQLTNIIIFINKDFSESREKNKKNSANKEKIEKKGEQTKIKIDWIVTSNLKIILSKPSNFDLAQFYFDIGNEYDLIKFFSNEDKTTLLQSKEYIDLSFIKLNSEVKEMISFVSFKEVILKSDKNIIIFGSPGSGKSLLIYKLFHTLYGLEQKTEKEMIKIQKKIGAIPIIINLKNCITDSLENIIRERLNDFNLFSKKTNLIYLLDGLDELNESDVDKSLYYLSELESNTNTKKIIITCRTGSFNQNIVKKYISKIEEFKIIDFGFKEIERYFTGKNNIKKISRLNELKDNNNFKN